MGEVLNLMARHNLLFRVIPAADPKYDLNIRLGAGEYSKADARILTNLRCRSAAS